MGKVTCHSSSQTGCHAAPYWDPNVAAHGMEFETTYYDTDNATVLKQDQRRNIPPPARRQTSPPPPPTATPTMATGMATVSVGWTTTTRSRSARCCPARWIPSSTTAAAPGRSRRARRPTRTEGNNYRRLTDVTTSNAPGLKGEYYDNIDLTNLKVTRLDPNVDYDWSNGSA